MDNSGLYFFYLIFIMLLCYHMDENNSVKFVSPDQLVTSFLSATQETELLVIGHKLEVLCYAAKDLSLAYSVSKLVIPALLDQLHSMRKVIMPDLLKGHPEVRPLCHFSCHIQLCLKTELLGDPLLYYYQFQVFVLLFFLIWG